MSCDGDVMWMVSPSTSFVSKIGGIVPPGSIWTELLKLALICEAESEGCLGDSWTMASDGCWSMDSGGVIVR
jgi:hypothetical protein